MVELTYSFLCSQVEGNPKEIKAIKLPGLGIHFIEDMSSCQALKRLDLSKNKLTSVEGLEHCTGLTWLNLSNNKLSSLDKIASLKSLVVLNASFNNIKLYHPTSPSLSALILNDNGLREIPSLKLSPSLKTLVLSSNNIPDIQVQRMAWAAQSLQKLSLSRNAIRTIPDLRDFHQLKELRLNSNKIIKVPDSLERNPRLCVLDLGKNLISVIFGKDLVSNVSDLGPLNSLPSLKNVNVKGNPLCLSKGYPETARRKYPKVVFPPRPEGEIPKQDTTDSTVKSQQVEDIKIKSQKLEETKKKVKKPKKKKDKKDMGTKVKKKPVENQEESQIEAKKPKKKPKKSKKKKSDKITSEINSMGGEDLKRTSPDAPAAKLKQKKSSKKARKRKRDDPKPSPKPDNHSDNAMDFEDYAKATKSKSSELGRSGVVSIKVYDNSKTRKQKKKSRGLNMSKKSANISEKKMTSLSDIFDGSTNSTRGIGLGGASAWGNS